MRIPRLLSAAALAAVLAVPFAASAQAAPPPPAAGHHHSPYMHALHSLNLSPQQKAQIKSFSQQSRQANQGADPATKKANREKLRQQISGVLSPDQRNSLQTELAREKQAGRAK